MEMELELYYINLQSRPDRREKMDAQLNLLKQIPWQRQEAHRPTFYSLLSLIHQETLKPLDYIRILSENVSSITKGSVGCFMSHMEIFRKCMMNDKIVIVLEDDVTIPPDFEKKVIEGLASIHHDFDMIYLNQPLNMWRPTATYKNEHFWRIHHNYYGTFGYILHPRHAQTLYKNIKRINNHIDNSILWINSLLKHNVSIYLFREALVNTNVSLQRDSDVSIRRRRRLLDLKIPQYLNFVENSKIQHQIQSWRNTHAMVSCVVHRDKEAAFQHLKEKGGFFIAPGVHCHYTLFPIFQHANVIVVEGNEGRDFFGCTAETYTEVRNAETLASKREDILIVPRWFLTQGPQKIGLDPPTMMNIEV